MCGRYGLSIAPIASSALAVHPALSQEDVWSIVVERSGARGDEGASDHPIHARRRQSLDRALEVGFLLLGHDRPACRRHLVPTSEAHDTCRW
jgi:hypothetical protein